MAGTTRFARGAAPADLPPAAGYLPGAVPSAKRAVPAVLLLVS